MRERWRLVSSSSPSWGRWRVWDGGEGGELLEVRNFCPQFSHGLNRKNTLLLAMFSLYMFCKKHSN